MTDAEWKAACDRSLERKRTLIAYRRIKRHGDELPTRAFYQIYLHREDRGGGFVAYHTSWDLEQKYRALYGTRDAWSLWSYKAPKGAKEIFGDDRLLANGKEP